MNYKKNGRTEKQQELKLSTSVNNKNTKPAKLYSPWYAYNLVQRDFIKKNTECLTNPEKLQSQQVYVIFHPCKWNQGCHKYKNSKGFYRIFSSSTQVITG